MRQQPGNAHSLKSENKKIIFQALAILFVFVCICFIVIVTIPIINNGSVDTGTATVLAQRDRGRMSTNSPVPTEEFAQTPKVKATSTLEILLPEYTIFRDNSYQDAGTVKVIWEILVPPTITKSSLELLLNELYKKAVVQTSGIDDRPIVIDIRAYISIEHATSGMGQWIGRISKLGTENEPSIMFSERQLKANREPPETRFGLSEEERIEIWKSLVKTEDRAEQEALQKYPDMEPYNEFTQMEKQLVLKYKLEISQRTGLSLEQLDSITSEGIKKGWPFPPYR